MHPNPTEIHDIQALRLENAKLRKFAEMFAKVADEVGCDHCPYCDHDLCDEETDPMKDGCRLYEELRELGVTDD